ncbi:AAA family ATPase [Flavitalea sp.]|nr:AAA family ATPase [Flavitalea sp.]
MNNLEPTIAQQKQVISGIAAIKALQPQLKPVTNSEVYYAKFLETVLEQNKDYPLPRAIANIYQNGVEVPLLTAKSFSLWQGKQKSKKTTALALLIAALISSTPNVDPVRFTGNCKNILFFDTEQGESYAARTMKLILQLAGVSESPRLKYCDLRELSPIERVKIIEAGIKNTPNLELVVIDGLVDLMSDFMDSMEGHLTVSEILKLSSIYDIHIAGVLHQNKSDNNARAHVGSISSQKCEMEISTEADKDDRSQSVVTCVNSRGIPFESFAIRWKKGSLPHIVQDWKKSIKAELKIERNLEAKKEFAKTIFKPFLALPYKDAVAAILRSLGCGTTTAKGRFKEMIDLGYVTKGPDDLFRIQVDQVKGQNGSELGQIDLRH